MRDNNATHGIRGKVNQFVYRQRFGETVVSKPPVFSGTFTENQKAVHATFKRASVYARYILADEAMRTAYKAKAPRGRSPFNMAVKDFFLAPEIVEVNLQAIGNSPGGTIRAIVTDDFRVQQVQVSIKAADGSIIESGLAIQQSDGLSWVYTTTANGAGAAGNVVTITAADVPGNSIVDEITI